MAGTADYPILRFFAYHHLPPDLRAISEPFYDLAWDLVSRLDGPTGDVYGEVTEMLRKLLEAKDCAVRAALGSRPEAPR